MPQTKILLDESEIPTHWYNVVADMPNPPAPPLGPDGKPIGPEALTAIFPMSLIEQEMSAERWIPDPRESARDLPVVASLAAVPRPPPGSGARHPGQDLLQIRRRLPGRLAQAQHRGRPGLLQRRSRHQAHRHRNRRRAVGLLDGAGRPDVRAGGAGLHGQGELRPETLPPFDDADLGRGSVRQPEHGNQFRTRRAGSKTRTTRARSAWRFPKRWKTPPRAPTPTTPWARC